MNLLKQRDEAYAAAKSLHAKFDENPTDAQLTELKAALDEVESFDDKIAGIRAKNEQSDRLRDLFKSDPDAELRNTKRASTLGEHFVKEAGEILKRQADGAQTDFSTSEYSVKAPEDPATSPANLVDGWGTLYQRTIVNQRREELVVADLMGSATVTNATIKYLVEKANRLLEGAPKTVAEGTKKPYIRFADFDIVTESLSKIAALTKISDEMIADYGFVADWINNQLIYELSVVEEQQLLNGDGAGSNITGLLNRSGIQTLTSTSADSHFDDIYKSFDMVSALTPLKADGLIINELDYQPLRLTKDANGQYVGGGPFSGQYGVGGILVQPPVWGKKTVVTNAVPRGTALTGAFRQGSTVLRKGGLRVDSTNTNVDDFENNLITVRAEERAGLMVPLPAAFVKINLDGVVTP